MYLLEDCLHKIIVKFHLITHQVPSLRIPKRLEKLLRWISLLLALTADDALPARSPWVFNIFRYKVMGPKDISVYFVTIGAWEGPIARVPAGTRVRTCHNEGMNLMNDYRDAAFLWGYPRPATNFRRCRASEIHLSSRVLTCRSSRALKTCTRIRNCSYFSTASCATDRTGSLRGYIIYRATQSWFLAVWFSGMLFAIGGIIALAGRTRVISYDDYFHSRLR